MKIIKFNMDLRLNPQDEYAVISPAFLPYSEENMEFAKTLSVDGNVAIEELAGIEEEPTWQDRIEA